jgi:UDPglucose 6-dehydrogenase
MINYQEGKPMRIGIVGAGYVGLSMAVVLAEKGYDVTCVDIDKEKIDKINQAVSPFFEEGLEELLKKHIGKKLFATCDYDELKDREIVFICVGTPSKKDGSINLDYVKSACEKLARILKDVSDYKLIVIKSTVLPTTTEKVVIPILEKSGKKAGKDFGVCMNPEFLREGSAIRDFFNQDRIVIGEYDKKSGDILEGFYREKFSSPIVRVDLRTAEMIKYASNAFLATKISFINEIGNICKKLGIDVYEVVEGMKYDPRIGDKFLQAGIGFGGSCFPKDLKAIINFAKQINYKPELLEAVISINEKQPARVIELVKRRVGELKNRKVAVLGLSFKGGTDDLRESRAIPLITKLLEEGAEVIVFDPKANLPKGFDGSVRVAESLESAINEAELITIATDWEDFKKLEEMKECLRGKFVIEGRRLLDRERLGMVCEIEGVCW